MNKVDDIIVVFPTVAHESGIEGIWDRIEYHCHEINHLEPLLDEFRKNIGACQSKGTKRNGNVFQEGDSRRNITSEKIGQYTGDKNQDNTNQCRDSE